MDDIIGLDAERVSNDPGRSVRIVAVDCSFQKIAHSVRLTDDLHATSLALPPRRLWRQRGWATAGRHVG
jgi:hypothetical protein